MRNNLTALEDWPPSPACAGARIVYEHEHVLMSETGLADLTRVRQLVFGFLIEFAQSVITAYRSDLYHDAMWLAEYMAGDEFTFWWSVDESGTSIGMEPIGLRRCTYFLRAKVVDSRAILYVTRYAANPS